MRTLKWTREHVQRILLLLAGLSLLTICAIAISTPPATGYEYSIYRAFPLAFWALLVTGLVASMLVILLATEAGNPYWRHAFLLVLVLYLIFLLLPLFRGYHLYGRESVDLFAHIGYTKTILATGSVASNDWYPVIHFVFAALRFARVPLDVGPTIVSTLLVELYLVGLFLYVRQEFSSRTRVIATLAVAVPLLFQRFIHTTHPAMLSFFLFPYVLLTYKRLHRSDPRLRQVLLLALLAPVIVMFHPLTTLIVIVAFVVLFASDMLNRLTIPENPLRKTELPVAIFMLGLFLVWHLSFERTRRNIEYVLLVILGREESRSIAAGKIAEAQAAPSIVHLLRGIVESYGPIFIYATIAGLGLLLILTQLLRSDGSHPHPVDVEFSLQFVVGAGIAVFFIALPLIVDDPVRVSRYMIIMSTLLTGAVITRLLDGRDGLNVRLRNVVLGAVVLLVIVSIPLSVTGSYNSNKHMTSWTEADHHGTGWLIDHQYPETYAISYDSSNKVVRYHQGQENAKRVFVPYNETTTYPRGFGYGSYDSLATPLANDRYVVTKDYDRSFYMTLRPFLRPSAVVYTAEDLDRLEQDGAVSNVYTNGGYQSWYVNASFE